MKYYGINRNFVFWSFLLVVFFGGIVLVNNYLFPKIDLRGEETITLNYKDKYKESGYTASFLGKDITDEVSIDGKVNTTKLGDYDITYTVGKGLFKRKITRHVHVSDTEKPKLSIDKKDMYVCPDAKPQKENVKATDNYDGDLTKKIKVKIGKDKITYSVEDSSKNKTVITKKVIYKDIEKPVITLEGESEVSLLVGDEFVDPGYKATDNCDKDVKVKVDGSVNSQAEGTYELKYTATDAAGNTATVSRKVVVFDNKGVIYLTFDDGPNDGTTNVILDILKEEKVKATFFVTCKGPDELIKREYDEGHTVALHTASHDYSIVYASVDSYFNDLKRVQDRVKNITGYESKIIRFPGGASNTISRRYSNGIMSTLTQEVLNRGYKYYDWNISSGDAGNTTDPNVVYSNVVNSLRTDRANMVLMHDIKPYTRDALRNIIKYGKSNGYRFEKITMDTEMITQRVNN